jgi:hypothetical protein
VIALSPALDGGGCRFWNDWPRPALIEGSAFFEIVGGSPNTWRLSGYEATKIALYHTLGRLPEPESTNRTC